MQVVLLDGALTSCGMGVADGTVGTGNVSGRPWHFQARPRGHARLLARLVSGMRLQMSSGWFRLKSKLEPNWFATKCDCGQAECSPA